MQQTTPVVVDILEVVTVIWPATQLETAVMILPRPASHVSAQDCTVSVYKESEYCHI